MPPVQGYRDSHSMGFLSFNIKICIGVLWEPRGTSPQSSRNMDHCLPAAHTEFLNSIIFEMFIISNTAQYATAIK